MFEWTCADQIARDDERVAEARGAVAHTLVGRVGEQPVDVRRIDEDLRLIVESSHVGRVSAEAGPLPVGINGLQEVPSIAEPRHAIGMRQRCQTAGGRRYCERSVTRGQVSGARHYLVERHESGKNLARLTRRLRFQRDNCTDVRRDAAGRAARIARDLRPGLCELMNRGPRQPRTNDRHFLKLIGGLRHQALRKTHRTEIGRSEIGRCPRSFFQIPRVDVTRRAGEKNQNAVLGGAMQRWIDRRRTLHQLRVEYRQEIRRHNSRAGDFEELPARETVPVDRKRSAAFTFALTSLRHGRSSVEKELEFVEQSKL